MLRAEQWLMIGVGALGLYAIYRMTRAAGPSTPLVPADPNGRGSATPISVPVTALPDRPSPVTIPPSSTVQILVGSTLPLRAAGWYQGRIETVGVSGAISAVFSPTDSRAQLIQKLTGFGFTNVDVYVTPQEASQDIYQAFALEGAGKGTRWFRARWPFVNAAGGAVPATILRPSGMVLVMLAAPPS